MVVKLDGFQPSRNHHKSAAFQEFRQNCRKRHNFETNNREITGLKRCTIASMLHYLIYTIEISPSRDGDMSGDHAVNGIRLKSALMDLF